MTREQAKRDTSGQVGPKLQGLGKALPNKQFLSFPARENLKNVQQWPRLPCLPFSGKPTYSGFLSIFCLLGLGIKKTLTDMLTCIILNMLALLHVRWKLCR